MTRKEGTGNEKDATSRFDLHSFDVLELPKGLEGLLDRELCIFEFVARKLAARRMDPVA